MGTATLSKAFESADIILKGKIIGVDTVRAFDMLVHDKKGIKVGKHKYREVISFRVQFKLAIDTVYKSQFKVPDTIYVLTGFGGSDCGVPFQVGYRFIISGFSQINKQIIINEKGSRKRGTIVEKVLKDTFRTSVCAYNRFATDEILEEIKVLQK